LNTLFVVLPGDLTKYPSSFESVRWNTGVELVPVGFAFQIRLRPEPSRWSEYVRIGKTSSGRFGGVLEGPLLST
jgi:hypothetical protein